VVPLQTYLYQELRPNLDIFVGRRLSLDRKKRTMKFFSKVRRHLFEAHAVAQWRWYDAVLAAVAIFMIASWILAESRTTKCSCPQTGSPVHVLESRQRVIFPSKRHDYVINVRSEVALDEKVLCQGIAQAAQLAQGTGD